MSDLNEFVDRYVAAWNEPDATRRRDAIAELWAEDGDYVSQDVRVTGREAISAAVTHAYDQFVSKGFLFKSQKNSVGHHDVARFSWEMVSASGETVSIGTEFFVFDSAGRIKHDYQFIEK